MNVYEMGPSVLSFSPQSLFFNFLETYEYPCKEISLSFPGAEKLRVRKDSKVFLVGETC